MLLIFLVFCVVLLSVFTGEFHVVMSVTISHKNDGRFVFNLLPVICRRAHILFTLFAFVCV
jgi:hypothetical protein